MDEPLFGERKAPITAGIYITGILISGFSLYCLIIGIVFGIKNEHWEHFLLGILMIAIWASLFLLYRWYRVGDIDEKFKVLIGIIVFMSVICGIAMNAYVWDWVPHLSKAQKCDGIWNSDIKRCYPIGGNPCNNTNSCFMISFDTGDTWCYDCNCIVTDDDSACSSSFTGTPSPVPGSDDDADDDSSSNNSTDDSKRSFHDHNRMMNHVEIFN